MTEVKGKRTDDCSRNAAPSRAAQAQEQGRPPIELAHGRLVACVILLVLIGLSLGTSEFVVIGIESDIAVEYDVPLGRVGQLISLFSVPYAVATPLLALMTGRFRRHALLVAYSALFILGNLVSALAQTFATLVVARILLGCVSGALLAVAVTFIADIVPAKRSSAVLSLVYASYSVAMIAVTSAGKVIADTLDWHVAMYACLALSVVVCVAAIAVLPRKGGDTDAPATLGEQARLLTEPAVICGMLIFVFGVGAVYVFYGYVTPYLEDVLGMGTFGTSLTLLLFGVFALASNLMGGWVETRWGLPALVVVYILQGVDLLGLYLAGGRVVAAVPFVFGVALLMYIVSVSCVSMFMRIARDRHPKAITLACSLEPLSFNVGIAAGTGAGGLVVTNAGIAQVGLAGALLSVVAAALVALTVRLDRKGRTSRLGTRVR